jgi:hypothetical protein
MLNWRSFGALLILCLALLAPSDAAAKASRGGRRSTTHGASVRAPRAPRARSRAPRARTSTIRTPRTYARPSSRRAAVGVARDSHGRIARSDSAKRAFMRQTGYANGRPGYVIDHVRPLACGGADAPSNMQWQTRAAATAKDKVERKGC